MKRVGFLIERIADLDNIYSAYHKACRGKRHKCEVLEFQANFDENIRCIQQELASGLVDVGHYSFFKIYDPKERLICAAPFRERVMQHAVMNVCHEHFDRRLIDTTYATRKGKGVYQALEKAKQLAAKYQYLVKLDYRKYYDSIPQDKLKTLLRKRFKDAKLLMVFDRIIDSYEVENGRGLPIGNLTSQYFANAYLAPMDYRAKHLYRVEYIRYMDDILMAGNDKDYLKACVADMVSFSERELGLTLKPPVVHKSTQGQVFCGYRVLPQRLLLSGRSKRRFRTKLLNLEKQRQTNEITESQYQEHILPLLAFVCHADSSKFRQACMNAK